MSHKTQRKTLTPDAEALQAYAVLEPLLRSGELRGPRGRRIAAKRLDAVTMNRKIRFGREAVRLYRRDTRVEGPIKWDKFVTWCKEHWVLLLLVKLACILVIL
jgi:hypothetical protein